MAKLKTAFVKVRNELNETREELERKTTECIGVNDKLQLLTSQIDSLKVFFCLFYIFNISNISQMELSSSVATEQQRINQLESNAISLQRQLHTAITQRDSLQRQYSDMSTDYEQFKVYILYNKLSNYSIDSRSFRIETAKSKSYRTTVARRGRTRTSRRR